MKYLKLLCTSFIIFQTLFLLSQNEILIVGTAHDLPEGMENNYEPILDLVSHWNPEVMCTEYIKPSDSLSYIKSYGTDHFAKRDSTAKSWKIDVSLAEERISILIEKLKRKENLDLRMELRNLFYLTSDKGNARFQAFQIIPLFDQLEIAEKEAFKEKHPMFNEMRSYEEKYKTDEFVLVEFPLAIRNDINYLHPTDDQTLRDLYHDSWDLAHQELEGTEILGEFESFVNQVKANMGEKMKEGSMVVDINSRENQNLLYRLEYSFMPVGLNKNKDLMNYYYMDRNFKMATHILEVAEKNPGKRIVVFYGVSHVPFIRKILRSESNHRILTLPDLEEWQEVKLKLNSQRAK